MAGDGRRSVSDTTHAPGSLAIEQPWTPSGAAFVRGQGSHPFRSDGRGLTITELQKVYAEAADLELATDLCEAERKFCVALSGFWHRLGTTHEATIWTALCPTPVHARQAHRQQAAEVANWLFRNLCEKWGLWHTQTMRHYLEIANILMHASRVSSLVVVLGSKVYAASRDGHDLCTPVLLSEDEGTLNDQLPDPLEYDVHMRLVLMGFFQKNRDPAEFDLQTQLADILISCDFPDVDFIPEILVEQCYSDEPPTIPAVQDLRTRGFLIRQLIDSQATQASKECEFARDPLQVAVDRSTGQISLELVAASHELAFLHIDMGEAWRCERVLSWMAKQLQSALKSRCQVLSTIEIMIRAGVEYLHRSDTSRAATWLESVYGYSSRTLGPRSSTTISLGRVVQKGT